MIIAPLVARNSNEIMVARMVGSTSAFGGSLELGGRFCVIDFGRNLGSVVMKMFHISFTLK
jgi:hypothetical protein